jgi:hypothetical protein
MCRLGTETDFETIAKVRAQERYCYTLSREDYYRLGNHPVLEIEKIQSKIQLLLNILLFRIIYENVQPCILAYDWFKIHGSRPPRKQIADGGLKAALCLA